MDLAAVDGREARAGGEDGGDDVGVGAQSATRGGQKLPGEEGEGEDGLGTRQAGDEGGVRAEVCGGEVVRVEGPERGVREARVGVEGDELREVERVREAGGHEKAGVELRGVRGAGPGRTRTARRGQEGRRQRVDAAHGHPCGFSIRPSVLCLAPRGVALLPSVVRTP